MNWLLRALGLAPKETLPEPPAAPPAAPVVVPPPRPSRAGMGLQILRGMPVLTAAKQHGCSYGTALRAAKRELERTPGFNVNAYLDFLSLGPQQRVSRVTNLRLFYQQLTQKRVRA